MIKAKQCEPELLTCRPSGAQTVNVGGGGQRSHLSVGHGTVRWAQRGSSVLFEGMAIQTDEEIVAGWRRIRWGSERGKFLEHLMQSFMSMGHDRDKLQLYLEMCLKYVRRITFFLGNLLNSINRMFLFIFQIFCNVVSNGFVLRVSEWVVCQRHMMEVDQCRSY